MLERLSMRDRINWSYVNARDRLIVHNLIVSYHHSHGRAQR